MEGLFPEWCRIKNNQEADVRSEGKGYGERVMLKR